MSARTDSLETTAPLGGGAPGTSDDVAICPPHGWRSQFGHPRGLGGRLAGSLMARKNAAMIEAAVHHLDVQPEDRVLEIGFGHGVGIARLAAMAVRGCVAGVDPSDVMHAQATHRNRHVVREGRVDLRSASVAALPFADDGFDKAMAVNSYQHWPGQAASLAEVRRVLRPGGTLLLALRMHDPAGGRFQSPGFTDEQVRRVARQVADAGFEAIHLARRTAGRHLTLLTAHEPGRA